MTDDELHRTLQSDLLRDDYLGAGHRALVAFRDGGGSQERALRVLTAVRAEHASNDELEPRVLEWMDFAWGWCQPRWRIW